MTTKYELDRLHSPGPWIVADCGFDGMEIVADGGSGRVVANVDNADGHDEANQRLIAAAPDLLYAAQKAERALTEFFEDHNTDPDSAPNIMRLRDAIAKAEGIAG